MSDLARKLETTPALIEAMLEDLARMGYLKQVGGECAGACAGCSLAGLCAAGEGGRVWALSVTDAERERLRQRMREGEHRHGWGR